MKMLKVELKNVYKQFQLKGNQFEKIMDLFFSRKRNHKNQVAFTAVKDVSFKVYEGDSVGIIGLNGSGKSTLSNLLAQVIQPTVGEIHINGETSLIAISAGLNNNLNGIDNIEQKCMMHGLKRTEIENIKDQIIEFADIGDYIYQPVKNYSSGMRSRLGFSIAVHTDPDILIIDEALSVGDSTFAEKSYHKMREFKEKGKTLFFVSHSAGQVKKFCDKAIWMHYGEAKAIGSSEEVIEKYQTFIREFNSFTEKEKLEYKKKSLDKQKQESLYKKIEPSAKSKISSLIKGLAVMLPVLVFGVLVLLGW